MSDNDNGGAIDPSTGHSGNDHTGKPYEIAPEHAHDRIDRLDERSHKNTLIDQARVEKKEKEEDEEKAAIARDPTQIAKSHGNEPSRGAKKDKELVDDDEEELRKKDEAKAQSKEHHKHHG